MNTSKIIKGVVGGGRYTVTAPIVKEDYGLYLKIEGLELPATYEVDFSNSEHNGTSVTMIGNSDGVLIPSQFIKSGKDVFAFLYHVGVDFGRTVYKFRIPNKLRPDRTDEEPTPEEQSIIDQAISVLNEAVAQTAQDKADADVSAQNASADAERAEESKVDAQNFATQAEQSATDAHESASQASASATASAQSAQTAQDALEEFTTPTASATTLSEGSNATASYADGHFSFGIPTGATGAKGDKGERGEQGIQGERGLQGPKGDKGDTGSQGIQGPKGDKGEQGERGLTGPQGPKGDTGEKGETGATGPQGIQGPKGDKGDTGPAGSDANVTSANIKSALGYVPVSQSSVNDSLVRLISTTGSRGNVLTYDSTVSDSKPYPWSWAPAPVGTTIFPLNSDDSAGIYYVVSQLKAAADNSGVASTSVPFEAGSAFLSNISGVYGANKVPIIAIQGASPNPIMRYLMINNLWAESLETGLSGAEMGYWDGLYHIEIVIGQSTITIIVEKKAT